MVSDEDHLVLVIIVSVLRLKNTRKTATSHQDGNVKELNGEMELNVQKIKH